MARKHERYQCPRLGEGCFFEGTDGFCCHSLFDPKTDNNRACPHFRDRAKGKTRYEQEKKR